jgi:uncharacterized protein YlxP (DUF503 family)
MMPIGLLTLHFLLPGCASLKEKRGRLKPLMARLHREFNISVAEVDHHDSYREALLACAVVSNNAVHNQQVLQKVIAYIESNWPDLPLVSEKIELI